MSRATLSLCLLLGTLAPSAFADTEFLPDPSMRLEAIQYAPTAPNLHWDTWIGGGSGLFRIDRTVAYFHADIETTAGNTRRAFDATQANYHLEPGLRIDLGGNRSAGIFFHHVSRHEIDTEKVVAVDWNVLGVRGSTPLPGLPATLTASVGHTTERSLIGYQWEVTGLLDVDVVRRSWGAVYSIMSARGVTTETSPAFPRTSFLDFLLEGGVRLGKGERTVQVYAAYQHRNDVLILQPGFKDRALFGLRIALRSATPGP